MNLKEILAARLADLGWSEYRLTQEVCKLREARGEENATVTRFHTSIVKALRDPANVKTYITDDIIEALGGEQFIRWKLPEVSWTLSDEIKIEH